MSLPLSGRLPPHLIRIPWAHPFPHTKRHLDWFSRFCTAHSCDQQTDTNTHTYSLGYACNNRSYLTMRCGIIIYNCSSLHAVHYRFSENKNLQCRRLDVSYLQSHVTPTQTMMTQITDDTPITATRIITARHTVISILRKMHKNYNISCTATIMHRK